MLCCFKYDRFLFVFASVIAVSVNPSLSFCAQARLRKGKNEQQRCFIVKMKH